LPPLFSQVFVWLMQAASQGLLWPPFHANWSTFDVSAIAMRRLLVQECVNATDLGGGVFDGCFIDRANFGKQMLANLESSGHVSERFCLFCHGCFRNVGHLLACLNLGIVTMSRPCLTAMIARVHVS
jgi:hypothetical protein